MSYAIRLKQSEPSRKMVSEINERLTEATKDALISYAVEYGELHQEIIIKEMIPLYLRRLFDAIYCFCYFLDLRYNYANPTRSLLQDFFEM